MSLTIWDLVPEVRPEFDDEPVDCPSRWYLRAERDRPAYSINCSLDVDHTGAGLDPRHGRGLARWTSEMAAESLAGHLASLGPRCTECPRPAVIGGMCGMCSRRELTRDDIETQVEAA